MKLRPGFRHNDFLSPDQAHQSLVPPVLELPINTHPVKSALRCIKFVAGCLQYDTRRNGSLINDKSKLCRTATCGGADVRIRCSTRSDTLVLEQVPNNHGLTRQVM